jgi:hypothetical protein
MNIAQLSKQLSANLGYLNTTLEEVLTLVFIEMGDSHLPETAHKHSIAPDISPESYPSSRTQNALDNPKPSRPLTH